jgi:hypothetical protein
VGKDPSSDHGYAGAAVNNTDHVYDATNAPGHLEGGRRRKRISAMIGLDTLNKPKTRIPWVVYILTLVQVIVFVVEIVKNGK